MKAGWQKLPFDEVVADESGGNLKTPQSEFLNAGEFAVVDQGKELVSGYVNDRTRLCRSALPVVVFGDHTRCIKFIDFPFCMGADGIKVLRPKVEADTKYLYHYLRQLRIHDGGYDRHFKYLKRADVVLPPLAEQRRIAEVLDRTEALRSKRRAALAQLDSLTQSLFLDLFGDPATNPKGFPKVELGEVVKLVGGYAFKSEDFAAEGNAVVRISNLTGDGIDLDGIARIPDHKLGKGAAFKIQPGEILIAMSGATTGKLGVVPLELGEDLYLNQRVGNYRIRDAARIQREFLLGLLRSPFYQRFLWQLAAGVAQPNVSGWQLESAVVPLPPIPLQREFARRVTAVEALKTAQRASLAELDALFATLQHRAFRGKL